MAPRRTGPRAPAEGVLLIPPAVTIGVISFILICILSLFSPTPLPLIAAGASLAVILVLLWRVKEPPILLFPVIYQWTSVSIKPILTAFRGVPLNELADYGTDVQAAAYFGLAAVTALAIGIRLGAGASNRNWDGLLTQEARSLPLSQVLRVSIALLLAGHLMIVVGAFAGPLRQVFLALSGVGYIGVFVLAYWTLKNRKGYFYLAALMIFEIGIGMTGFFSDFRAPVLMMCVAALCARSKMNARDMLIVAAAGALLISLGAFWSDVKREYRDYVSLGTMNQVVSVSLDKRIEYMGDQIATFDGARYARGLDLLLARHSYIDFLSAVMHNVPESMPHENGKRLGGALLHIITPRALFAEKAVTEFDSDVTVRYTGLPLMIRDHTSISIGYLGELYIDFSIFGSIVACLAGGLAFGTAFRLLRDRSRGPLILRFGLCAVVALSLATFDTALIKLVGGVATVLISAYLLQRFVLPYLVKLVRLRPRRPPMRPGSAMRPAGGPRG